MFRVSDSEESRRFLAAIRGLLAAIVLAAGVTSWLVWELQREQTTVTALVNYASGTDAALDLNVANLPEHLWWQHALSILVLVILVATGVALVLIRRGYVAGQRSLRRLKELAGDILASIDLGVVTTDKNGCVTSINDRGRELLGIDYESVGLPLDQVVDRNSPFAELHGETLRGRQGLGDRDYRVGNNDPVQVLRAECHPLRNIEGELLGTVLHLRDVTERILLEQRVLRMERYMGLGSLASGLHHEIKNPLSALSLHVQLLEEELEEQGVSDAAQECLAVLKTEVTRVNGVLDTFRDYASLNRLSLRLSSVDEVVEKAIRLIQPRADQQSTEIRYTKATGQPIEVMLDPIRLEQVVLNLIINALEALDQGRIDISVNADGQRVQMSVTDNGSGIPRELQERIFDPYFSTKDDGSGMGLALSEKIVREHGGSIDFDSGPWGTTFRVSFPREVQS